MRSVEAGESTASHGVPVEDRWVEESGLAAADPEAIGEGSGSGAAPHETMEGSGSSAMPHEMMEGSGSSAAPHETMEGSGSGAAPHETMGGSGSGAVPHEVSPPALEQGVGSKRSRLDELGQGSRDPSPKCFRRPRTST